jgi:UDP-glucose 4-epimerase
MMKKVVVFGGAGFLGRYTVRRLLEENKYDVYSFDQVTSPDLKEKYSIVGDIFNREDVKNALSGAVIVFNYAAIADIEECINDPVKAVATNILGNTIILDECVKAKVSRFILASSVYSESDLGGVYRSTKNVCESLTKDYKKYYDLDYTILRYGTIYGPGANRNNSVYRFLDQALDGKIEYQGTGDERRDYIHASDAADLTIKSLSSEYENRCMILTGERSFKTSGILSIISEIMNDDVEIVYNYSEDHGLLSSHYQTTPYKYVKDIPKKMIASEYIDVGLGLIDCLSEINDKRIEEKND